MFICNNSDCSLTAPPSSWAIRVVTHSLVMLPKACWWDLNNGRNSCPGHGWSRVKFPQKVHNTSSRQYATIEPDARLDTYSHTSSLHHNLNFGKRNNNHTFGKFSHFTIRTTNWYAAAQSVWSTSCGKRNSHMLVGFSDYATLTTNWYHVAQCLWNFQHFIKQVWKQLIRALEVCLLQDIGNSSNFKIWL